MDIKRNGTQPSGKGPAEWFTGTVRIDPLFKAPDPALQTRLVDLGGMIVSGSPADFGKLVSDETEKWAKVIKFAGIKSE